MITTIIAVITICAPIFALILFGALVRRSGMLTPDAHRFVTWLVYYFSLPLLVFLGICKQDFRSLLNASVVGSTFAAFVVVGAAALAVCFLLPLRLRGPFIVTAFLSNLSYMGFPLASNAFGAAGLSYAGIVNAFSMPVFTIVACLLLTIGSRRKASLAAQMRSIALNPVIIAAVAGVACAFVTHETPFGRVLTDFGPAIILLSIGNAILSPVAALGLPLSLVAVGAALHFENVKAYRWPIAASAVFKLIVSPLVTYLFCRFFFPAVDPAAVGTAVLLMACPVAVAAYVLSEQIGADTGFVASDLAVSTAVSCVTIPVWVLIVLR